MKKRHNRRDVAKNLAAFVQTLPHPIPSNVVMAAFPTCPPYLSLLRALGIVESRPKSYAPTFTDEARAKGLVIRQKKAAERQEARRLAKIASTEAKLAALRDAAPKIAAE